MLMFLFITTRPGPLLNLEARVYCCGAQGDYMVMLVADWSAGRLVAWSVGSEGWLVDTDVLIHDAGEEPALT